MSNDIGVHSSYVDLLFDTLKGNVLDALWFLCTFRGYNPFVAPFHAYLVDFPINIM